MIYAAVLCNPDITKHKNFQINADVDFKLRFRLFLSVLMMYINDVEYKENVVVWIKAKTKKIQFFCQYIAIIL